MAKSILSVGLDTASGATRYEPFTSKASLLDYDIILFAPNIEGCIGVYEDDYLGKPCLDDRSSFAVKEAVEHWRREIFQAYEFGKTIIVFLCKKREIYVATGRKNISGTGRNQRETRIVDLLSNYNCIPMPIEPVNASGSEMRLEARSTEVLGKYWNDFGTESKYEVVLSDKIKNVAITTKVGNRPLGAIHRHATSSGAILLLPDIDFQRKGFVTAEGNYTKRAVEFSERFVSTIVALDNDLRVFLDKSPEPEWAMSERFALKAEIELRRDLLEAENRVALAQKEKEDILLRLDDASRLRGLLYEKGNQLERCIIDALTILGFAAANYKAGSSEFDVVFESAEGRLLGEAEGRDTKAINVDKLRQLTMNIHEDYARDEVVEPAKGVLFGNGFRFTQPDKRENGFTEKCITASRLNSTALVSTLDLFAIAKYILESGDAEFSKKCRQKMLSGVGNILFDSIPGNLEGKYVSPAENSMPEQQ